ncbi:MAG: hypothetical protein U0793_00755 [Gemmataceae bacterium]
MTKAKTPRQGTSSPTSAEAPEKVLSSIEILAVAVFLLDGHSRYVDTEDIAVKANEIAPGKFSWVKYQDQINIHTVKTHLWDAKSERKGNLLLGSEKEGWMLTSAGLDLARSRLNGLKGIKPEKKKLSEPEKQWMRTERLRMVETAAYKKCASGQTGAVTLDEAEAFFRLNSYVVGKARERKIVRVLNLFGDDSELGDAVKGLAGLVRGK